MVLCYITVLILPQTELQWWTTNRTINVTSSYTNKTYQVAHYNVTNSAPRPEVRPSACTYPDVPGIR